MSRKSIALPASQVGPGALAVRVERSIAPRRVGSTVPWGQIQEAVTALAKGRLLPQGMTVEQAIVACAKGAELGIPPMQAIQTIPVINGRPAMEAKLMLALAFRHLPTFDYRVERWDAAGCELRGRRSPAHSWLPAAFTEDDAKRAGLLGKGPWRAHPKAMYFARACAMLCRAVAPDVFAGLYDPDEAASVPAGPLDELEPLTPVEPRPVEPEASAPDEPWDLPADEPEAVADPSPQEPAEPSRESMLADLRAAYRERKGDVLAALEAAALSFSDLKRDDTPEDVIAGVWRAVR